MILQHAFNFIYIRLCLRIAQLQLFHLVARFFEPAEDALGLFGRGVKALQLGDEAGDHVAHLAQVFRADILQRRGGKIRHLFLAGRAVLQNLGRVGKVYLFCKVFHLLLFLGRKAALLRHGVCVKGLGRLGGLFRLLFGGGVQRQARGDRRLLFQRQAGGGGLVKRQVGGGVICHDASVPFSNF